MNEKKLNSETVRGRMEQMGFNQADVAAKLGVTRETASQWLKNNKRPRPKHLLELAEVLELSISEIVMRCEAAEPQVAYRAHRNKTVSSEMKQKAADMGAMLRKIIPYLPAGSFFKPAVLENPKLDFVYIQNIARFMRQKMNIDDERVEFESILQEFSDKKVVLIPVLWGRQGNNALHIRLPKENLHFVYLNLDALMSDFKFWLLHELAHIITPDLDEAEADEFADRFAGAVLFPEEYARRYYHRWEDIDKNSLIINYIKELANTLLISPLTIYKEINRYAKKRGLREYSFNIHPAVTNFNKTIHSVSEVFFEEDNPSSEIYIEKSSRTFRTPFFEALGSYLREKEKGPGMIQRMMDIPLLDAKGVYKVLVSQ